MITFQRGLDKWYFSGEHLNSSLSLYLKWLLTYLLCVWIGEVYIRVAPLCLFVYIFIVI